MARRRRQQSGTGIYHVMIRGVNRDAIFLEEVDYERFLSVLAAVKEASGCIVLAYCLMPNHAHLVLRVSSEPIGDVIKRLSVRYVGWFNRKYQRVGHLFQGRFKSLSVEDDAYLVTLVRYVWRNPVEAGLSGEPQDYRWSSFRFLGSATGLVDEQHLLRLLPDGWRDWPVQKPPPWDVPGKQGRPLTHTDAEAAELLCRDCGATNPAEFRALEAVAQQRAISALRMRGVTYETIARLTGSSATSVRRRHVAGPSLEADGVA